MATHGYIRTSRDHEPGHPGSDPEVQRRQLIDAGVDPGRIYSDVAVSGATPGSSRAQWRTLVTTAVDCARQTLPQRKLWR